MLPQFFLSFDKFLHAHTSSTTTDKGVVVREKIQMGPTEKHKNSVTSNQTKRLMEGDQESNNRKDYGWRECRTIRPPTVSSYLCPSFSTSILQTFWTPPSTRTYACRHKYAWMVPYHPDLERWTTSLMVDFRRSCLGVHGSRDFDTHIGLFV